jgi:hypothetical protein
MFIISSNVDPAEGVDCLRNQYFHSLITRNGARIGHCNAAGALDFLNHSAGDCWILPGAVVHASQIVHDDLRAASSQFQGVRSPQSIAGTRHDGNLSVESYAHYFRLCVESDPAARACHSIDTRAGDNIETR